MPCVHPLFPEHSFVVKNLNVAIPSMTTSFSLYTVPSADRTESTYSPGATIVDTMRSPIWTTVSPAAPDSTASASADTVPLILTWHRPSSASAQGETSASAAAVMSSTAPNHVILI